MHVEQGFSMQYFDQKDMYQVDEDGKGCQVIIFVRYKPKLNHRGWSVYH